MKTSRFDIIPQADGRRRVWFLTDVVGGLRKWAHKGWLMPEVRNHVPEQPTNRYKQALIDRQRAAVAEG